MTSLQHFEEQKSLGPLASAVRRRRLSDMNCGRTSPSGLSNRFRQQLGAGRNLIGFDRTNIEPDDVAVTRRKIEHFTRSDQHAERGGTLDHFGDIAQERVGSLLADSRVEDRVIYIRTFSKSIAPDLPLSPLPPRDPKALDLASRPPILALRSTE